jgi:tetratricopeptide (TPR) repeat protein
MRFFVRNIIILVLVIGSVAGCISTAKKNSVGTDKVSQNWAQDMQGMAKILEQLMPYVFSRSEFHSNENQARVGSLINDYSRHVHVVDTHVGEKILGDDPMVKYNLDRLKQATEHAREAYKEGNIEYSRNVLAESVGACFSCHSTNQIGPEKGFSTTHLSANFRIFPTEKADFYVATRQYDRAIDVLENVLKNPTQYEGQPHEQVSAIKKYLSLMVRVRKDPVRASETLEMFLSNGKLPFFVASDAEGWLGSLRKWKGERKTRQTDLSKAKALINQAKKLQSVGSYQAGYVENLRATGLLHDAIKVTQSKNEKAEIYFLLGSSYDVISDLGVWDLPEVYYESCVRIVPNSTMAKRCFKSYERSIILGFSGSAGIFIPTSEKKKLADLKALAGL